MNDIILDSLPVDETATFLNDVHNSQSDSQLGKLRLKYVNSLIKMKDSNSIIYNPEVNLKKN